MEKKKTNLWIIAAVVLVVIAVAMVITAISFAARNRAHDPADTDQAQADTDRTESTKQTTPKSSKTDAESTDPPETSLTEPPTEAATTEPTATDTTSAATEKTENTSKSTASTTTKSTTATTATTKAETVDLGVLGYDLSKSVSTDKSRATGNVASIIINEICAKNKSSLKDKDGDYSDWIELYNPTDKVINLEGVGLSDDAEEPLKWVFPSVNIQPKSYLVVFCSDKNTTSPQLHTNFKIASENELILLSKSDGSVIDYAVVSESDDDVTFGRYPNASSTYRLLSATPGKSNDKSSFNREAALATPILSRESGFYDKQFSLSIAAAPGTTIYYTTDGSVPTTSSKKYSSKITVRDRSSERAVLTYKRGTTVDSSSEQFPYQEFEKATIIRAIAVDSKGRVSNVATATYFVGSQIASKYKSVSVISVTVDPDDFYDSKKGIYVAGNVFSEWRKQNPWGTLDGSTPANFNQRGIEWERDAHIDFFRSNDLEFAEDVGVRIHGGWSRNSQQKSLKFYFRSEYGESKLKYQLFENNRSYADDSKVTTYKRFMIRNGGNDSFIMLFKDAWTQECIKDMAFATQSSDIAICFLNGEYWGVYTLNEVYDDHYVEENYGVDSDNVIMIKAGALEEGADGDYKYWQEAFDFVKNNDMSAAANYKKACEYFDMESFAEYIAMEVYIGNEDWIWNNWACWRAKETSNKKYHDGKWRFMVYDTEYSMDLYGSGNNYRYDIFTQLANGDGHLGPMVKSLLKSSEFKAALVVAFEDVMNVAFNPTSAATLLDNYYKLYGPYLEQHFNRFILWQNQDGVRNNVSYWKNWLKNRYNYMPNQINSVMNLGTTDMNTLTITLSSSSGGTVKINGLPLKFTNSKWQGKYFAGYKITIEAVPASGYEFTGWSGDNSGNSAVITVDPTKALNLKANFSKK